MSTKHTAQGLAGLGRNGDSTLVHMQPQEVAGLQAIAKAQGTSLTINPDTGLPEAFSLGGFFESLAPTLAGLGVAMIPGMQPYALQAGIAAGAATGALTNKKNPLMGAVMGGMGGYGGANLANAASSFGTQAAKAGIDPSIAAIQTPGAMPSAATVAENVTGFQNAANLNAGLPIGGSSGAQAGIASQAVTPSSTFGSNLSQAYSNVAADPMGFIGQNKMAVAMPLGGAVLGGLEPSDLGYGTNLAANSKDKYDPYATLNLNTNTGLKLYAEGGPVSFADGGMPDPAGLPGGGSDAMQGAGMLPLDVSDINAKYGYNPDAGGQPSGGIGMLGYAARPSMPSVSAPVLGLFADNDQIEAARSAYESQLAAAMAGRGGMGSTANAFQIGQQARQSSGPMGMSGATNTVTRSMADVGGIGSTANTADTAPTAETALSRLNLNKTYANGGTVQTGGIQDLYATSDNPTMNPSLSRDGYGLGRLQQLADGGVAGYAEGGNVRTSYGGVGPNGITTYVTGGPQHRAIINSLADTFGKNTDPSNEFGTLVRRIRDYNYPTSTPSLNGRGAEAMQGGNLNLNTASGLGMAKGGYLDGAGDGMSDSIPATIEGKQPARLADGEFVVSADVVSHLGNGSTKAGAKRLYGMMDKVRKARTGTKKQGKQINPNKFLPA